MVAKTPRKSTESKATAIDAEIAKAEEKLKKLQDAKKEELRKERERSHRAVLDLIKSERLDVVPIEKWKVMLPKIKALLLDEPAQPATPAKPDKAESVKSDAAAK